MLIQQLNACDRTPLATGVWTTLHRANSSPPYCIATLKVSAILDKHALQSPVHHGRDLHHACTSTQSVFQFAGFITTLEWSIGEPLTAWMISSFSKLSQKQSGRGKFGVNKPGTQQGPNIRILASLKSSTLQQSTGKWMFHSPWEGWLSGCHVNDVSIQAIPSC